MRFAQCVHLASFARASASSYVEYSSKSTFNKVCVVVEVSSHSENSLSWRSGANVATSRVTRRNASGDPFQSTRTMAFADSAKASARRVASDAYDTGSHRVVGTLSGHGSKPTALTHLCLSSDHWQ